MKRLGRSLVVISCLAAPAGAQTPEPDTRVAVIEQAQAEKATQLHPYVPHKAEKYLDYAEGYLTQAGSRVHPFFQSAYQGGGFTVGAGYLSYLGSNSFVDVRGSLTPIGYKRVEAEFASSRLFSGRGALSVIGGWREATAVGFYGFGTAGTSVDDRVNYGFTQPYGRGTFVYRPLHRMLLLRGALEASQWTQTEGRGSVPSIEEKYTPETLPGLGATVNYFHTLGTVAFDSRTSPGYARRGGSYGVTFHDYSDRDGQWGFTQIDYEAIQHVPVLREAWVLSLRATASTTAAKGGEQIPFFMLPSLGGGSSLRGFQSWRFRDRNSLELQAEWRVMVNRFIDLAAFSDAGKVTAHTRDLDLDGLKYDYGLGIRFHGPLATPLRVDIAKGPEGFAVVWAAGAAF